MLDSTSKVLEDSARGGFYLTLGKSISTVVSALSLVVIARVLGSEQYGLYTISTVFPSLLLILVNPGITQGIMKFSASLRLKGEEKSLGRLLLHSLFFKIILGLVGSTACFLFADQFAANILNRPDVAGFIKIASALIIFQTILATLNASFVGLDKTEYDAVTTIVQSVTKVIVAPALVLLGFSIAGALIGQISSLVLSCSLGLFLFTFKIYRPLNHSNGDPEAFSKNLRILIGYGFPLYVSILVGGLAVQYRNIILSIFASNLEIGNFQAAMNFTLMMHSLSIPIATMLLPAFSKIQEKRKMVAEFFRVSVKYTCVMILPVATLLMVYANEVVQILYGEGYELAGVFLSLYIAIYFLVGLGFNTLGSFYNGLGETKMNLKIALLDSVTFIVLAPPLALFLKAEGIMLALLISALVGTLYGLYSASKSFKVQIDFRATARVYVVSLTSALPLLAIRGIPLHSNLVNLMIGAAVYCVMYLLLLPATRVITLSELREIRSVLENIRPLRYLAQPILHCEEWVILKIS